MEKKRRTPENRGIAESFIILMKLSLKRQRNRPFAAQHQNE
ncbi:hypothetical protein HmCmsJML160_01740 [Escherichia coli]|nr:hypothetical protein HmCmsJML160_01740 [Escherichia coli]